MLDPAKWSLLALLAGSSLACGSSDSPSESVGEASGSGASDSVLGTGSASSGPSDGGAGSSSGTGSESGSGSAASSGATGGQGEPGAGGSGTGGDAGTGAASNEDEPPLDVIEPEPGDPADTVAVLPRPEVVEEPAPTDCPQDRSDLTPWDPSWMSADGVVDIPAGVSTLILGNDDIPEGTLIASLNIPADSEVIFADQESSFLIREATVAGALRLGSPTCRLSSHVEFVFDTDEDVSDAAVRQTIYDRQGLGIAVPEGGQLDVFGRLYQPTWTRLTATAEAGSDVIGLAEEVDWESGQKIVVVTSDLRDYPYNNQNEVRTLTQVSGASLKLDTPLEFLHYGGPEYQIEVGLLSRSIVFRTSERVLEATPTFGGHIMVMGAARISGAEVYGMGQQNFLGRYPLHFHHAGDVDRQSYFTDNSIWRSNWRCAVVHRTDNAIVSRNVAYDVFGHCYYIEDGVEQGNEISFNLASRVKIMGSTDDSDLRTLDSGSQEGFIIETTSDLANPADRAAAGFYITNGNNQIVGNATSGGFAGYSFPNLPEAIGGNSGGKAPMDYEVNQFDGNSAHTAGYFWSKAGCIYSGGVLKEIDGENMLEYQSGRPSWNLVRPNVDSFSNTKTFLCTVAVTHWGGYSRIVNLEAWDTSLLAKLFGSASIDSAIFSAETGNTANLSAPPTGGHRRGFQFYDTDTQTIIRDIQFRHIHKSEESRGGRSSNDCAFYTMVHSDEFTPQRMTALSGVTYIDVDESQYFCNDDSGTLASRNFNINDTDGSAAGFEGSGFPAGPLLIGSGYSDSWNVAEDCIHRDDWGLWVCPQRGTQNVATLGTSEQVGVVVTMYDLSDGHVLGDNWYSDRNYDRGQISGPSEVGWHYSFENGIPDSFNLRQTGVPEDSFVIVSFSLPAGVSCSVSGWDEASNLSDLLGSDGEGFATDLDTCFIRVAPTDGGSFEELGMSVPNRNFRGDVTINTGCGGGCSGVVSSIPAL